PAQAISRVASLTGRAMQGAATRRCAPRRPRPGDGEVSCSPRGLRQLGELGRGAFGVVTKVEHARTGNTYALKAIARSRIQEHSVHLCVEREVDCHSRMDHPNIVKLFQHFEDSDSIYLLLEFATGGQLYAHMRQRGVLPDLEAAGYFSDVVHALIYVHGHGIAHRDTPRLA
ncbi:unnamed protein product, partial [Prorocentrum cordatum]